MPDPSAPAPPTPDPGAGVIIGLKDLYIEVLQIKATLSELGSSAKSLPDHENRLRAVERWLYGVPVAILTAIAAVVSQYTNGGK